MRVSSIHRHNKSKKKKKHVKQSGTAVPEITLTAFISSATPDKQTSGIGCAAAELPVQRRSLIQFLQRAFKRLKHISTTNSDQKHPIYLCLPGSYPRMQEKKENKIMHEGKGDVAHKHPHKLLTQTDQQNLFFYSKGWRW